jgi:hypothetical protein
MPPGFVFATLYRIRRWQGGRLAKAFDGKRYLGSQEEPARLLE